MATRSQNEHDFPNWEELPDGGRRYWVDKPGRVKGFARYIKIVDANEVTRLLLQEIYDERGRLTARHQKYPVDTGHQIIDTNTVDKADGKTTDHDHTGNPGSQNPGLP